MPLLKHPRRLLLAALVLGVFLALLLPSLRPHSAPRYTVTDLGVLPGDTVSSASGINNHGDIVGFSGNDSYTGQQLFLYHHEQMTQLGPSKFLGGPAISNSGQINPKQRLSSYAILSAFKQHHAILYSGSRKIDFIMPPGWETVMLRGVNDQGQTVGSYRQTIGNSSQAAFVYDSKTRKFSMLPQPPGGWKGFAEDINDHGQIAGIARQPGMERAMLWNASQPAFLPTVPGRDSSEGLGVNNQGEVVGTAGSQPNAAERFVNDYPQHWRLLVPFFKKQWENHAVLYKGGKAQDLNTLIPEDADWALEQANGINDKGQIVGQGLHHGQQRAFLLTPR